MNTPAEIMTALRFILAEVPPLSLETVSIGDWGVQRAPYSVIILPPTAGQQRLLNVDGWEQVHRIKAKLTLQHQDRPTLYGRMAEMIPLILTALQQHDTLGLPDVLTCHPDGQPVTYDCPHGDEPIDELGVLRIEIDFAINVVTLS